MVVSRTSDRIDSLVRSRLFLCIGNMNFSFISPLTPKGGIEWRMFIIYI